MEDGNGYLVECVFNTNAQLSTTNSLARLVPGALMCIMVPFIPETPRIVISHGKAEQGLKNLTRLRKLPADHPYVQVEYSEIKNQVDAEQEVHKGHSYSSISKDIFTIRSNLQRFILATMLFLFHKFTGKS